MTICVLVAAFLLDENSAEILEGLPELKSSVTEDTRMVLVYASSEQNHQQ